MSKPLSRLLTGFGPVLPNTHPVDLARTGAGALLALLVLAGLAHLLVPGAGLRLIAPFGASAVLLFAVPNSPLAQPWSVLMGNTVSAVVAVAVVQLVPQGIWSVPLAVALAIMAMMLTRALHPPGGAVAMLAALSPDATLAQGWAFVLLPVAVGSALLIGVALIWHRISGRAYPQRQVAATADAPQTARIGLGPDDLAAILDRYRQSANLGVADLARLIGAAEEATAAQRMDGFTCDEIMSRDLVTVLPDTSLSTVADIFRSRGFTSLPVVADGRFLGVIFQLDLIRQARNDSLRLNRNFFAAFARLLDRSRKTAPTAADIMQVAVPRVTPKTPVGALLPMLADGGVEAVPVVVGPRILGIVTRSDLVSALAREVARR